MASLNENDPWKKRIAPAIDMIVHRLDQMSPHRKKYAFQWTDGRGTDYFQLAEKAGPGEVWADGQKWRTMRGPSKRQIEIIEQTSHTVAEIADRIMAFLFEGKDTTAGIAGASEGKAAFTKEDLDKAVTERVQAILSDPRVVNAFLKAQKKPDPEAAELPEPKPVPKGIQKKPPRKSLKADVEQEIAVTKQRCAVMGIPEAQILYRHDGAIDRRWLTAFNRAFEARSATPLVTQEVNQ